MLWGLCAIALLMTEDAARAWGPEGHEVVVRIAFAEMTPAARRQVEILLDGPPAHRMAVLSSWADWQGRKQPGTKPWHYVDIPIEAAGYDRTRDCASGDCVVEALTREQAVLADASQSPDARAEALLWVIHLVGDLHQPLHCADHGDRGGNGVPVSIGDYDTNLHRVWDSDEVAQLGLNAAALAGRLDARITSDERKRWRKGTPQTWANQSHAAAQRIYRKLPRADRDGRVEITRQGLRAQAPIAARQLQRAGIRLALLLNAALTQPK